MNVSKRSRAKAWAGWAAMGPVISRSSDVGRVNTLLARLCSVACSFSFPWVLITLEVWVLITLACFVACSFSFPWVLITLEVWVLITLACFVACSFSFPWVFITLEM